ncbi:hypothetical protein BD626DRAFT_478423, partial [Schizophyllum amplum]
MTICESRTLPPSWIRWNSQNIPADALNALFYPPERDRALAKYGDGSSQCSYGIISLQNSGLGCLSVELDVFTVVNWTTLGVLYLSAQTSASAIAQRATILLCGVVLRPLVTCALRIGQPIFVSHTTSDIRETLCTKSWTSPPSVHRTEVRLCGRSRADRRPPHARATAH